MKFYTNLLKDKIRKANFQSLFQLPDLDKMNPKVSVVSKENYHIWSSNDHSLNGKIYIISQNIVSAFFEFITSFSDLKKVAKEFSELDFRYMPKSPPISPLSKSYFAMWYSFDHRINSENTETISVLFQKLARHFELKLDPRIISALMHFDNSNMSFYEILNLKKNVFRLRELISNEEYNCTIVSGYNEKSPKCLFVRLLPNLVDRNSESIILSTPYAIVKNTGKDWLKFFERQGISPSQENYLEMYKNFMKYGISRNYWHEYIMDAYFNYRSDVIFLTGIPDIKGSKPHELGKV